MQNSAQPTTFFKLMFVYVYIVIRAQAVRNSLYKTCRGQFRVVSKQQNGKLWRQFILNKRQQRNATQTEKDTKVSPSRVTQCVSHARGLAQTRHSIPKSSDFSFGETISSWSS